MRALRYFRPPNTTYILATETRNRTRHEATTTPALVQRPVVRLAVEELGCRALPGSMLAALGAEAASLLRVPEALFLPEPQQEVSVDLTVVSAEAAPSDWSVLNPLEEAAQSAYWTAPPPADVWSPIPQPGVDEPADDEQAILVYTEESTEVEPSIPTFDRVIAEQLVSVPWIVPLTGPALGETFVSTNDSPLPNAMTEPAETGMGGAGRGTGTDQDGASFATGTIVIEQTTVDGANTNSGYTPSDGAGLEPAGQLAQLASIQRGRGNGNGGSRGGLISPMSLTVTVVINTPTHGSHVAGGGSFTTFGYVSPNNSTMTAWVTDGANTYNGKKIFPVPHMPMYQWGFSFTGVPTGHEVQLTVHAYSQGDTGSQTITITLDP